ncbi:MAG: hypothetical protein ABL984_14390, partial [Pyrinomonadaceae bacterium]
GQQRSTHIFQRATQGYMRRLAWRQLVQYARHRPSLYPWLAAHALAAYTPEDRGNHKGAYDVWARAYVFHRVLRGESKRFDFMARTLSFRTKYFTKGQAQAPEGRVESFPELWDAAPGAYVPLLARSKLVEVLEFAVQGVKRHPEALYDASHADVLAMLGAPHDDVVAIASAELERRFDPKLPDWTLVDALLGDARPTVRSLGQRFLATTAALWTMDLDRAMRSSAPPMRAPAPSRPASWSRASTTPTSSSNRPSGPTAISSIPRQSENFPDLSMMQRTVMTTSSGSRSASINLRDRSAVEGWEPSIRRSVPTVSSIKPSR